MIDMHIPQQNDYHQQNDDYPDTLYMCPKCRHTKTVVGIGTVVPDLMCRCEYPNVINEMIEMIPKLPVERPKDTRLHYRLKRKWREEQC